MSVTIDGTAGVSTPGLDDSGNASIAGNASVTGTLSVTGATSITGAITQGGIAVPRMVLSTAQTASGSSVDFTGIPSWVKRITVVCTDVSFAANGASRIRLGTSGGLVSTGYVQTNTSVSTTPTISVTTNTDGIAVISAGTAATVATGQFIIVNVTGNTWQCSGFVARAADNTTAFSTGYIALSGTLDRLSIVATTSTFDAGTINILYEG